MKKIILGFLASFSVAAVAKAEAVRLSPGEIKSLPAVAASNEEGVVTLRLQLKTQTPGILPTVQVKEYDGMVCEVSKVSTVLSTLNGKTKVYSEAYDISVIWYPGADWSSCVLEVSHPDSEKAGVALYVEGDYSRDRGYEGYDY